MNCDGTVNTIDIAGFVLALLSTSDYQVAYPGCNIFNGDINGDHNAFNDLAPDTKRNHFRLPWQISFDPRVARRFGVGRNRQLSVIWEAFNLTNRPNYTAVDNTLYSLDASSSLVRNPLFRRKTGQGDGRVMQLAAKFAF